MDSDAIRNLLAAATPGPVEVERCPCGHPGCRKYTLSVGTFYQGSGWDNKADADLFAAAPDLAAEVLRLRDRLIAEEEVKIRLAYRAAEEIGKLNDALAFYANPENWRMGGQLDPNSSQFRGDAIAHAALKETDNG